MEAATENERRPTVDRRQKAVRKAAGLMQIAAGGDLASQRQERVGCYAMLEHGLCHHMVPVHLSVTFMDSVETNKHIFKLFHHW